MVIFIFALLFFANTPNFSLFKVATLTALIVFTDFNGGVRVRFLGYFNGSLIDSVLDDGALVGDAFGVFAGTTTPDEILRLLALDKLSLGCWDQVSCGGCCIEIDDVGAQVDCLALEDEGLGGDRALWYLGYVFFDLLCIFMRNLASESIHHLRCALS